MEPCQAREVGETGSQQLGVVETTHAVGQHSGKVETRIIVLQTQGQSTKGLGHGRGIHDHQYRKPEECGEICRGRNAIEQTHDTLHQNQVGILGGF